MCSLAFAWNCTAKPQTFLTSALMHAKCKKVLFRMVYDFYKHSIIHISELPVQPELWISALTDHRVRHGRIPTSVLQGPLLASVAKLIGRGRRNSIPAYFRCNLQQKRIKNDSVSCHQSFGNSFAQFWTDIFVRGLTSFFCRIHGSTKEKDRKHYN